MRREIEFEGIPEGYEPVRWSVPNPNELFFDERRAAIATAGTETVPMLIVRPVYKFPDFIPEGWWIAMDSDGAWEMFEHEPKLIVNGWGHPKRTYLDDLIWTPPEVTDWKQSKVQCRRDV